MLTLLAPSQVSPSAWSAASQQLGEPTGSAQQLLISRRSNPDSKQRAGRIFSVQSGALDFSLIAGGGYILARGNVQQETIAGRTPDLIDASASIWEILQARVGNAAHQDSHQAEQN